MTSISTDPEPNQRLIVLRALSDAGGKLNETLVARHLHLFGHGFDRDQTRDLLKWLEERDAIETEMAGGVVMIATLTQRGENHLNRLGPPIDGIDQPSRR